MQIEKARLREALAIAETRALAVYGRSKEHSGAGRSEIYALGRFEGLKEALRLLEMQKGGSLQAEFAGPPRPAARPRSDFPLFASIFQKLRPRHGPSVLGRW